MSPRAHPARVCFWCLKFLTVPLRAPNIGCWTLMHLRKYRIEAAQAAESRQQRNLDHWQLVSSKSRFARCTRAVLAI
jgi:hypothetical protein